MIEVDMVDAIKVQFLKPIFEDDFPEKGMTAWLTDIVWDGRAGCYKLYFDFSEFEDINDKYFKQSYYPNVHTAHLKYANGRELFTAKESNMYFPKYSVLFSISEDGRNDAKFAKEITDYLRELA